MKATMRIVFTIALLSWSYAYNPVQADGILPEIKLQKEIITFTNANITLHGTLTRPKDSVLAGNRPAIIMVHGSGRGSRTDFDFIVNGYARAGFVVLAYDKRSNWIYSSLSDLAGDVAAAARFLEKRKGVDANRIGALGISQGGWVLPLAALKSEVLDFMIVITGGGASPRSVEIFQMMGSARHSGANEGDLKTIEHLGNKFYDVLASGLGHEAFAIELEKYKDTSWFSNTPFARPLPDRDDTEYWGWIGSYKPVDSIRNVTIPTLVLLGREDYLVPLEASLNAWEDGFRGAGNADSKVIVVGNAGHGLTTGNSHDAGERQFIENYFTLQFEWLSQVGIDSFYGQ